MAFTPDNHPWVIAYTNNYTSELRFKMIIDPRKEVAIEKFAQTHQAFSVRWVSDFWDRKAWEIVNETRTFHIGGETEEEANWRD